MSGWTGNMVYLLSPRHLDGGFSFIAERRAARGATVDTVPRGNIVLMSRTSLEWWLPRYQVACTAESV